MPSRWDNDSANNAGEDAQRRATKEIRKKEKKQCKANETQIAGDQSAAAASSSTYEDRPPKRRRLSLPVEDGVRENQENTSESKLLRFQTAPWHPCRSIDRFQTLNHIEEGSYGFVSRAREEATGDIVAIKRLKLNTAADGGFPVTALREIQCLSAVKHEHVVHLREVVTDRGDDLRNVYLVMDFLEHDLKTLQEEMVEPFLPSEVKTLMLQLGSAVEYLHDHWILHRDLKTSNILMNNQGQIKIADFGMARFCGDPPPGNLTQLVVTLWYRAPELLLGTTKYDSAIDIWSMGCIFGELLVKEPLFQGKNEVDQLRKIFTLCGIPTNDIWPGFKSLPNAGTLRLPATSQPILGPAFQARILNMTESGLDLMTTMLALDPARRTSAKDVLGHPYFKEEPRAKPTVMFPSFPSKAGQERRRRHQSPSAPARGAAPGFQGDVDLSSL